MSFVNLIKEIDERIVERGLDFIGTYLRNTLDITEPVETFHGLVQFVQRTSPSRRCDPNLVRREDWERAVSKYENLAIKEGLLNE